MTQSNPLRVGLIGAGGRWGPRAHVPALKGVSEAELYAVCTAHAETAQAAADKFGVTGAYGNDKALGADREVEAVVVAVRVPAHYELSKNAIEAGKHVYCEWPLGANTKEAEELAALARQKNVRTMAGLQRRASPAYLYMRELIQQGYVGQVLSVNMTLMNSGVLTRPSDRTWQRDATLGANTLTITFGHVLDAMCMVVGELTEVSAIVAHAGAAVVRDRHEEIRGRHLARQHRGSGSARKRRHRQCLLRRPSVPRQRPPLRDLRPGRHAVDDRRRRGRRGTPAQDHGRTQRRQGAARVARAGTIQVGAGSLAQRSRVRRGPDVGQVCRRDTDRLERIRLPDFDHAVRRHRMLDTIVRASQTGQRQKVVL